MALTPLTLPTCRTDYLAFTDDKPYWWVSSASILFVDTVSNPPANYIYTYIVSSCLLWHYGIMLACINNTQSSNMNTEEELKIYLYHLFLKIILLLIHWIRFPTRWTCTEQFNVIPEQSVMKHVIYLLVQISFVLLCCFFNVGALVGLTQQFEFCVYVLFLVLCIQK